jgi:crotonobetainyl-CoA:carnitine CoA-transferase CaiB-like acyl-CoA transferase
VKHDCANMFVRAGPGPLGAQYLADQGASVIKVENANGMGDRFRGSATIPSPAFAFANRGKRSVTLDTKQAAGIAALGKLMEDADVFLQNFRPGVVDRMGIGYDAAKRLNPAIIYVSISGFGADGPCKCSIDPPLSTVLPRSMQHWLRILLGRCGTLADADQMVYDFVIQALCGVAAFQEGNDGQPQLVQNIIVDKVTALTVSQAVTAALFERTRTGQGQHISVSMLDTGINFMGTEYADTGVIDQGIKRPDSGIGGSSYQTRATTDGHVVLNLNTVSTWTRMKKAFNDCDWANDPRWDDYQERQRAMKEFAAEVETSLGTMSTREVVARLRGDDLPGSQVLSMGEIHEDAQVIHSNSFLSEWNSGTGLGKMRVPRAAPRFHDTPLREPGPTPSLGEHTK